MKVVDASIAAKWFFLEAGREFALAAREAHLAKTEILAAPDLLLLELSTVFWKKRPIVNLNDAQANLRHLFDLGLEIYPTTADLSARALEISYSLEITPYDGVYVALAEKLGAALVSADRYLAKKAKRLIAVEIFQD